MSIPDPTTNLAVELAELRGEIRTGLEQINGKLGVLVERTNRTDADVRQLRIDTETELQKRDDVIKALRAEVEALKSSRWPIAQLGALVGVGALVAAVVAFFIH
ncbi:hypothetical protein ACIQCF_04455 [Streptomyces sp. NPDC088353]|uniref:hypothetical protein n=1 Tax=unclassified Streptomyces TaxID=2593676 RepID=UPI0037FF33E6